MTKRRNDNRKRRWNGNPAGTCLQKDRVQRHTCVRTPRVPVNRTRIVTRGPMFVNRIVARVIRTRAYATYFSSTL